MRTNILSKQMQKFVVHRIVLLLLGTVVAAGCDSGGGGSTNAQQSHLRALVSLHNAATRKLGKPPANEEEFRQFINSDGKQVLERMNVASAEDLLKSERDGQPFVVVYGRGAPEVRRDVVAYEQTGVDGKRYVGLSLGSVEEVDEAQFSEYVKPAAAE